MNDSPERIYNWLNSQLSIARFYGGCKFNCHEYRIAYDEKDQPLVRVDLLKKRSRKRTHDKQP